LFLGADATTHFHFQLQIACRKRRQLDKKQTPNLVNIEIVSTMREIGQFAMCNFDPEWIAFCNDPPIAKLAK
jgi:hypothetical protein